MTYSCPVCGIADENAYHRCYHPGCLDGRDQPRNRIRRDPDVEEKNRRLFAEPPPTYYTTPPDYRQCMNFQEYGPTPCWHPHCDCFEAPAKKRNPWTLMLLASMTALVISVFMLLAITRAPAMDHGFNPDAPTTKWFQRLMRPDFKDSPCCDPGEFYPISRYWQNKDANGTPTGTWSVEIADGSAKTYPDGQTREYLPTGTIVEVYDGKVNKLEDDLDNPTDTGWIAMRVINAEVRSVFCVIRHPEGN